MINMVSEGIDQALAEKPINDENANLVNENTTMRAELTNVCNMIAKLDPQANHMQQPHSTCHRDLHHLMHNNQITFGMDKIGLWFHLCHFNI
eukprot:15209215-Ditylum_brightwellii.AAC.1